MIYGIKADDFILATYDTPEEAYEAAKFAYGETGSFHGVVAITPFEEEVSKLQEKVSTYRKRELELVNALMNIKRELAWGDAENAVSKATYRIENILRELQGGEIDNG
ncbi:hypothetical protein M5W76_12235 [Paenibacillus larvae]|uniref:Uncharacterized protein n=5 Tax=Fernvirus TaxID=2843380 RepID=A0A0K2CXM5_9CAUD|nr:hypothetical protein [Paenibacillus larvae]YP_009203260.1 hypothetical protein FERN_58 [Paenibacillus phage Fern]YP_009593467.1 hypothetical protein FDG84_gp58 [Paenibacillus phage Willow]YP_009836393.1 hypothetical protein HWB44_gp63 [Paenibacillus phage PBL1c]YP_009838826.1 hypothetical protein HWB72_gp55 [Paenibacillus phage Lucielle]AXF40495.1 hypothetical protein SAUDAGE_55 [Paenibacillus phage Saudage]QVV19537.1 hypothetical protein Bohemia_63 [Paenibacillus phage Bohemia]QVV20328.1